MNNKFNNVLNDFFANTDAKDDKELEEKLQEFMQKYNNGEIEYEATILDDAYELLEKAENAKSKKQAMKYAKEAYDMCPDCFDALLFQVHLEDDPIKKNELLDEGLEFEKSRLEDEGYFEEDNIGCFYGIFETRPYIRGLCAKAHILVENGKMKLAIEVCKEVLRLNNSDNTGTRYLYMALCAYLEDEKELLKLYEEFPEENLEVLFPLFALYYKLGNDKKAKEYLDKINAYNPHFIKFFKGTLIEDDNAPTGFFSPRRPSEVSMYVDSYFFLFLSIPTINYYVLKNSRKKKSNSKT